LEWRDWTKTEEGYRVKRDKRTKMVDLRDKYAKLIWEYRKFMKKNFPSAHFLFPSGKMVFGESYTILGNKHLSGRHLLGIIKQLDPECWMHLFRESKGAEIARKLGQTITAVYKVKDTLDLEKEATAYRYIRRYAVQEMDAEIELEAEEPEEIIL